MIRRIAYAGGFTTLGIIVYCGAKTIIDRRNREKKALELMDGVRHMMEYTTKKNVTFDPNKAEQFKIAAGWAKVGFAQWKSQKIDWLKQLLVLDVAVLESWKAADPLVKEGMNECFAIIPILKKAKLVVEIGLGPYDKLMDKDFLKDVSKVNATLLRKFLQDEKEDYPSFAKELKKADFINTKDPEHQEKVKRLGLGIVSTEYRGYQLFQKGSGICVVAPNNGFQVDLLGGVAHDAYAEYVGYSLVSNWIEHRQEAYKLIAKHINRNQLLPQEILRKWAICKGTDYQLISVAGQMPETKNEEAFKVLEDFIWEISGKDFQKYSEGMLASGLASTPAAEALRRKHRSPSIETNENRETVLLYLYLKGAVSYFPKAVDATLRSSVVTVLPRPTKQDKDPLHWTWKVIADYIKPDNLLVSVRTIAKGGALKGMIHNWWTKGRRDLARWEVFKALDDYIYQLAGGNFAKYKEGMQQTGLIGNPNAAKMQKYLIDLCTASRIPEGLQATVANLKQKGDPAAWFAKNKAVFHFSSNET